MSNDPRDATVLSAWAAAGGMVEEILIGLSAEQKSLPTKLLYDAVGSDLFDRITRLPEYYLTRTETALLDSNAADIVASIPGDGDRSASLIEFGASDESKAVKLFDVAADRFSIYVAINVEPTVLDAIRTRMKASHPSITVETVTADFLQALTLPDAPAATRAVGFFPGNTIGNFMPSMVVDFLAAVREALSGAHRPGFLIGSDLCRDFSRLLPAYDDAAGVNASFNLNILRHVNRLVEGTLKASGFRHKVVWNDDEGRVEMSLESLQAQTARVAGRSFRFAAGETIRTGTSYKYTRNGLLLLAAAAGWTSGGFWQDADGLYGLHLLLGAAEA